MNRKVLKVHPADNVLVALKDLSKGEKVSWKGEDYVIQENVPAKHKFPIIDIPEGNPVFMYGVLVGKAIKDILAGGLLSTANLKHASSDYDLGQRKTNWEKPDITKWGKKTFMGFHRKDGSVGTANHWLVIPLVFCENRNIKVLEEVFLNELGFKRQSNNYQFQLRQFIDLYKEGKKENEIINAVESSKNVLLNGNPVTIEHGKSDIFPNVDGIKFLTHHGGCGGTRQDAQALCGLLAGYITHPNVAGATVLSLGCQNAQPAMLIDEIAKRDPFFEKPLFILDQQKSGTESALISEAMTKTFTGLIQANKCQRQPAPISKLCIGLECGGSDGFSGISANPAIGYTSDLIVALGGSVILSEFPELCAVEQELSDRCIDEATAKRFMTLMKIYNERAKQSGSGFDMNPSPGNIKDGLITDAIKSAGAAKKGGSSPIMDVLDFPEKVTKPGLNLLCTPGNDVESTTAEVGSGATVVLFTSGLGTPTGNPVSPVIKISSNTVLYNRMHDIIDINTGTIIEGEETIEQAGERILEYVISVASGEKVVSAVRYGQNDFIPWKRGVSL